MTEHEVVKELNSYFMKIKRQVLLILYFSGKLATTQTTKLSLKTHKFKFFSDISSKFLSFLLKGLSRMIHPDRIGVIFLHKGVHRNKLMGGGGNMHKHEHYSNLIMH